MSKTDAWKAWEGRVVDGKYPLRQWLGGSDHSAVFVTEKGGQPSQKAAIKLIDASTLDPEREVARISAASKLSHPHLLSIYSAGRCSIDGTSVVYVVMEHADEDLSQILPQRALTPVEVSDMLPAVLDGLLQLHSNNFVHSRIRPSNILAAADQLKLSTDQATPVGEPLPGRRRVGVYDAPEVASGTVSPAADIWSLGVTIITALTQQATPQTAASQGDSGLPGNLPEPFRSIARECLHIEPQQRISLVDIRARLQGEGRSVPAEPETKRASERDSNRLPVFVIPLVLVVLALAAWGLFHARGKESSAQPAQQTPPTSVQTPAATPSRPKPSPSASPVVATKSTAAAGTVLHQVMPDVSQSAKNTIRGTIKVSVQVQVDATGKVTSAKLKSAGPSRYFAGHALKAAEQWQFAPAQANGQPATSAWLIQFRFKRNSVQAEPERITR
jgi:TonB family protein